MIEVENKVELYELNGDEISGIDRPTITVKSHWNDDDFVIIVIDNKEYTVAENDIITAIKNACNINKHG